LIFTASPEFPCFDPLPFIGSLPRPFWFFAGRASPFADASLYQSTFRGPSSPPVLPQFFWFCCHYSFVCLLPPFVQNSDVICWIFLLLAGCTEHTFPSNLPLLSFCPVLNFPLLFHSELASAAQPFKFIEPRTTPAKLPPKFCFLLSYFSARFLQFSASEDNGASLCSQSVFLPLFFRPRFSLVTPFFVSLIYCGPLHSRF